MGKDEITSSAPATQICDVLVIGGGPAGSTISALPAGRGYQVIVLEKAHHPEPSPCRSRTAPSRSLRCSITPMPKDP